MSYRKRRKGVAMADAGVSRMGVPAITSWQQSPQEELPKPPVAWAPGMYIPLPKGVTSTTQRCDGGDK